MSIDATTMDSEHRQDARLFTSFAITGGLGALVNLAARYALSHVAIYEIAVAQAYLIGMTTAFVLTRRFVFEASGSSWIREYLRFALVNVVAFIQVWVISVVLARIVFPNVGFDWHPEEVAHLIGVMSPIITSYYLHKHFSFRRAKAPTGDWP